MKEGKRLESNSQSAGHLLQALIGSRSNRVMDLKLCYDIFHFGFVPYSAWGGGGGDDIMPLLIKAFISTIKFGDFF